MSTYFYDSFGGSGTLTGRVPDTNLNPAANSGWQPSTSGYLVQGGGWLTTSGGDNATPQIIEHVGTDGFDWGTAGTPSSLYGPVSASFTVRTPTSLSGTGGGIIGIKLHLNGVLIQCGINHVNGNWWLSMTGAAGQIITGSIAANTVYHLTAVFQNGASSVTVTELSVTQNSTTAFTSSVGLSNVYACVTESGALGPVTLTGSGGGAVTALVSAPAVLGRPALLGAFTAYAPPSARCSAPSPLGACRLQIQNDSTRLLGDVISVYVMDLITPTGTVRVPISSWQATLQTGASCYVQCVVPACAVWAAAINAATEFAISRRAVLPGGQAIEVEMARAPADTAIFDQGPSRYTCTLSGYSTAFGANTDPAAAYDRTLTGVRSVSSGTTRRVRCAVDWLLRPGQRAWVQGTPLVVGYINYYAPSGFDAYMDVGEQR